MRRSDQVVNGAENTADIRQDALDWLKCMGEEGTDAGGDSGGSVQESAVRVGDEDDGYFRLIATVNDTARLRWWLLSFGSKVEVLEPWLCEEIAHNAYWMNRMYLKPTPPQDSAPDANCS